MRDGVARGDRSDVGCTSDRRVNLVFSVFAAVDAVDIAAALDGVVVAIHSNMCPLDRSRCPPIEAGEREAA